MPATTRAGRPCTTPLHISRSRYGTAYYRLFCRCCCLCCGMKMLMSIQTALPRGAGRDAWGAGAWPCVTPLAREQWSTHRLWRLPLEIF